MVIETINIKKWGNSAGLRIPYAMMKAANLEMNSPVTMRYEDGKIVIEPHTKKHVNLDVLLNDVTEANLHHEISTGRRIGKEAL